MLTALAGPVRMSVACCSAVRSDNPIEAVNALLEELFSRTPGIRGCTEDVRVALHAGRAGESYSTPFVQLPSLCCEAVGGYASRAIPVMAAWYALMLAARILDDLEDADTAGTLWAQLGTARAVNVATGLILAAPLALLQLEQHGVRSDHVLELLRDTQRTALHACAGQHEGLARTEFLNNGWEVAEATAGEPFALACRAGAIVGEGTSSQVAQLGQFGQHLGVLTQIADDVADIWQVPGDGDLAAGRETLPVLYALAVSSPTVRSQLRRLLDLAPHDPGAALQARQMLAEQGALHALVFEAEVRRQQARSALEAVDAGSPAKGQLLELVDQAIAWMDRGRHDARCSGG